MSCKLTIDKDLGGLMVCVMPLRGTGGWAWITLGSSINLKPEKRLKTRHVPASQVHALLGGGNYYCTLSVKLLLILKAFLRFLDRVR
jgi:hypothetical protein